MPDGKHRSRQRVRNHIPADRRQLLEAGREDDGRQYRQRLKR